MFEEGNKNADPVKKEEKTEEKPAEKPPVADMKKFLEEKLGDKKTELEGKTDEEIAKMFDEAKAKEAADANAGPVFKFDDIKIPETMPITPETKEKVTAIAAKHKLGTEAMQELIDTHVEIMNGQTEQWEGLKKTWRGEVEKDPVLGGKNLETVRKAANDVVRKFAGNETELKEFQEDLILLGLGNKKSFIRFLNNVAAKTKEDTLDGAAGSGEPKKPTAAQRMWPNMKSESA